MKGNIIVFSAHPDDETLGCGGTMARRIAEGYEVFVVVMTDGRNALSKIFGIKDAPTPEEMREIRRREIVSAMSIIGVPIKHISFLDFEDGKLLYNSRRAATQVCKIIKELKPAEIYFPHEKDHNPDHQAASIILKDCVENLPVSTRAYQYSLGQRFSRVGSIAAAMLHLIRNNLVYIDVSEFVDRKATAIKEYRSQIRIINRRQNRPVVTNYKRFLKSRELFYRYHQAHSSVDEVAGKTEQKYFARTYEDGDEVAIVQLFEKAYGDYGGYAIKTPEEWRWCCLQRPDVEKNGILVALSKESREIVGYVVAGKSGYVWELSYDPQSDGEEIVSLLLDEATLYIKAAGASSVNFTAPQKDVIIKRVSKKRGFVDSEPPKMFLSVLNLQRIISLLANNKANELTKKYDETVLIKIKDPPFWVDPTIFMQINQLGVKVGNETQQYTMQLQADYFTFSSILFGNTSPFSAFIRAKLKIKPLTKTLTMLKLLLNLPKKEAYKWKMRRCTPQNWLTGYFLNLSWS